MRQPDNTLTIRFRPATGAYRVDLAGPPVGEVSGAFTLPAETACLRAKMREARAEIVYLERAGPAPIPDCQWSAHA